MEELYFKATELAQMLQQTIGEKNDYYITLKQLMDLMSRIAMNGEKTNET